MTSNTTPSPEDAMDSFLALEYEQCISLLTRYDDRQLELAQHATIISCAVVAVVFGLSTITDCTVPSWPLVALLSCLTLIALLVLLVGMVQNRLYFVFVARQVNAIRKREVERLGDDFENRMYVNTDFSAYQPWSTHQFMLFLVALQAGLFSGIMCYSATADFGAQSLVGSGVVTLLVTLVLRFGATRYLRSKSENDADAAVHPKN